MRYATITEKDPNYIKSFSSFLVQLGCKPVGNVVFEADDSIDLSSYHGVEVSSDMPVSFEQQYAGEIAWLMAYTGNFPLFHSFKEQYQRTGRLSPKQIECVRKSMNFNSAKTVPTKQEFSVKAGDLLVVGRWMAEKVAREAGYAKPHYTLEVVDVHAETARAIEVTVKLSAQRTSFCGCCGRSLTDPDSIAMGIGPICADKAGVSFSSASLDELRSKLQVTLTVKTWMPKSAIKNGEKQ